MAATDALRLADLTPADIAGALALSDGVGWNQTREDWALFITRGRTIGLFDVEQGLVATAAALPYDNGFGWISMVIVAPEWRRRGLARRLMTECIATLRRQGRAALLDATPAGAQVYGGLGFVPLCGLERWEGEGGATAPRELVTGSPVTHVELQAIDRLTAADGAAFGAQRGFLLEDFLARKQTSAFVCDDSYLVIRFGHRAMQIGPLIASSPDAARRLLAIAIATTRGRIFLDLLEPWSELSGPLKSLGFRRQRPYVRMALDRTGLPGDPRRLAIAAGPEFG